MSRNAAIWIFLVIISAASAAWYLFGNQRETITDSSAQSTEPPLGISGNTSSAVIRTAVPDAQSNVGANANQGEFERLAVLLANGQYEEAVDLYATVYSQVSEAKSDKYRARIVTLAQSLSDRGENKSVLKLLQHYVDIFYKDIAALTVLARSLHVLERYPAEIDTLLAALDEAHLEDDVAMLKTRLDQAVKTQAAALRENNDPVAVASFYQALADRRPDHPPLRIGLAGALISAGQVNQAVAILKNLAGESKYTDAVSRLLRIAGQHTPPDVAAIPVQRIGNSYVVQATINRQSTVTLLIDTGATMTVIRPHALQLAGIYSSQSNRMAVFNTANGPVKGPVFELRSLGLGEHIVENIEVGSTGLKGLGRIDGLLGMNFLNQFEFTLNQQDKLILLTR